MTNGHTLQIHPFLYRITAPYEGGGVVYLFLISTDRVTLVDTGTASSPSRVVPAALAEIGLAPSDVDLVLCTHGHADHAGGNAGFKKLSRARIYLHPADLPFSQDLEAEIESHTAPLRRLGFPESFVKARRDSIALWGGAEKVPVDAAMADGEVLDLGQGIDLKVVHVPGHSPGHVALYWQSEGILFAGDALQGQGPRAGGYPHYFQASEFRRSLAVMQELDYRMLCLGHACVGGGPISDPIRTGEDAKAFMKESIRVVDAIHAAVSSTVKRMPGATKREIALAALSDLVYELPQQRLRETQMPASAGPTLLAHIEAALNDSYPS